MWLWFVLWPTRYQVLLVAWLCDLSCQDGQRVQSLGQPSEGILCQSLRVLWCIQCHRRRSVCSLAPPGSIYIALAGQVEYNCYMCTTRCWPYDWVGVAVDRLPRLSRCHREPRHDAAAAPLLSLWLWRRSRPENTSVQSCKVQLLKRPDRDPSLKSHPRPRVDKVKVKRHKYFQTSVDK